ncbi:MAG: META domain-containing protein [Chitinophagales bacterium]|nr:META domain-containing protein [Chitinophagales bacterium]
MKQITLLTVLFMLLTSFQSGNADQPSLYHTKWVLNSIHDRNVTEYIYTRAFLQFDDDTKRVSGNGSCNSFGGTMDVSEEAIQFGNLFSTKMYCADVQDIETLFLKQLGKVNRYEIKGTNLKLFKDDTLLLSFKMG